MTVDEFQQKYCRVCGTQRCLGDKEAIKTCGHNPEAEKPFWEDDDAIKKGRGMSRLTYREKDGRVVLYRWSEDPNNGFANNLALNVAIERLHYYEDLFANIPDERLEEIARAEAEGRCVVLPFAVGDMVKPKGTGENVKPIRVDAVTIYKDARPTISFHEQGMKMTYVDEWSEDAPTEYDKVAALDKRGEDA